MKTVDRIQISIVIPVYMVEQYLRQCIDSVLNQTYQNIEVVLVDDGSPDSCPQICDEYAKIDRRVQVIHKSNGGLSDARNAGILQIRGDYTLFIDSDDYLRSVDSIERLVDRIRVKESDVLSFAYCKVLGGREEELPYFHNQESMPLDRKSKREQLAYLSEKGLYIASACNKLIRSELLKKEALSFQKGDTSEDVVWCLKLLKAADSFDYISDCLYCYRQREGSISQTITLFKCRNLCRHILKCIALSSGGEEEKACWFYTAYQYAAFMKVQTFAECLPEDCIQELAPYSWLLKYDAGNKKVKLLRVLTQALSYPSVCRLLYFLNRNHRS